jgi:hypothetical protein
MSTNVKITIDTLPRPETNHGPCRKVQNANDTAETQRWSSIWSAWHPDASCKRAGLVSGNARLRYAVEAPGVGLNRNRSGDDSPSPCFELNVGESDTRFDCLSQKSAQKYQHEENRRAASTR